jgi:hypothetical protein
MTQSLREFFDDSKFPYTPEAMDDVFFAREMRAL